MLGVQVLGAPVADGCAACQKVVPDPAVLWLIARWKRAAEQNVVVDFMVLVGVVR